MRLAGSTSAAPPIGRFASCGSAQARTSAWEPRLPARRSPICSKLSWRKSGHGVSSAAALPGRSSFLPMRNSPLRALLGRAAVRDEAYPGGPDERLPGPLGWSGGRQTRRRYRSPPVSHERAILPPILMIVFVDTLGYAAVVPLIPLVLSGQGAPLLAVGTVFAAFSLCQLLTAPLLGRLSDRVGRRPVLAFSLAGSVAGFALLAISSAFPVVLLSRIIDGCSAGNVAMCYAAVLDSDSEDKRRRAIPALGAAAGAGIVAGLGLSAFLAGFGFRAVALAAMLLSLLCLALTLIAVPETRRRTSPGLKISAALRIREVQRAVVFVALCAALQAAFLLTLPVYFASALGLSVQATTALIALIVLAAAAFQV